MFNRDNIQALYREMVCRESRLQWQQEFFTKQLELDNLILFDPVWTYMIRYLLLVLEHLDFSQRIG